MFSCEGWKIPLKNQAREILFPQNWDPKESPLFWLWKVRILQEKTNRQWVCSVHPSLQNNIWSWQSVVCCLDLPKYNLTSVWPKHDELSPLNLDILQFHLSSPLMTNAILLLLTWRTPFPEYQMTNGVPGSSVYTGCCLKNGGSVQPPSNSLIFWSFPNVDEDSLKTKMGGYNICVCIWHSIKSQGSHFTLYNCIDCNYAGKSRDNNKIWPHNEIVGPGLAEERIRVDL